MSIVVAFEKTIDLYNQNQHWIAIILWSEITESTRGLSAYIARWLLELWHIL